MSLRERQEDFHVMSQLVPPKTAAFSHLSRLGRLTHAHCLRQRAKPYIIRDTTIDIHLSYENLVVLLLRSVQ